MTLISRKNILIVINNPMAYYLTGKLIKIGERNIKYFFAQEKIPWII